MKWKVITAKKKNDEAPTVEKSKKDGGQKEGKGQNEISYAEQQRRDEANRHANVDIIWNDVTIPAEKLS